MTLKPISNFYIVAKLYNKELFFGVFVVKLVFL